MRALLGLLVGWIFLTTTPGPVHGAEPDVGAFLDALIVSLEEEIVQDQQRLILLVGLDEAQGAPPLRLDPAIREIAARLPINQRAVKALREERRARRSAPAATPAPPAAQ